MPFPENEQINIIEINKASYYETVKLRNNTCCFCKNDFRYKISKNKRNFKKSSYEFFELIADNEEIYYCHFECLEDLCEKFYQNNSLKINNTVIMEIKLCNRFGERQNSKNYLKDIKKILFNYYTNKFKNDIKIQMLFTEEHRFSFHCIDYKFKPECLEEFNQILEEYNNKSPLKITLTPRDMELYLSK